MNGRTLYPRWTPWFFIAPFVAIFVLFTVYPLLQSVSLSMQQTYGPRSSRFVFLDNFRFLLSDPLFHKSLWNTAVFAAGSVFLQLPCSLGLALWLNRPKLRGRAFFRLIFFCPSLVGIVFVAMMFSLIFERRTGLLNVALHQLLAGWDLDFPWLQQYVMAALILAAMWMYIGFNMVYFLAALQNVDRGLIEAAMVDGANPWQRFVHVTLPAIRPVGSFVVLLSLLGSFQLFELPFVLLGGGGPDNQGLTVVMYLYQCGFDTGDLGYASAIGWLLALLLIAFAVGQRWIGRTDES
ncbi:MAG: sugar ABC transporter permease [Phycisphaeraceae bacterium]|nr:sugar ABC transporter permease [Phycisphaeraceae bacterium]